MPILQQFLEGMGGVIHIFDLFSKPSIRVINRADFPIVAIFFQCGIRSHLDYPNYTRLAKRLLCRDLSIAI